MELDDKIDAWAEEIAAKAEALIREQLRILLTGEEQMPFFRQVLTSAGFKVSERTGTPSRYR